MKWLYSIIFSVVFFLFFYLLLYIEAYEVIGFTLLLVTPFLVIYFIKVIFGEGTIKKKIILIVSLVLLICTLLLSTGHYVLVLGFLALLSPLLDMLLILGVVFVAYSYGKKLGTKKVRKELKKILKSLELDNPYIYFREIPNKYGVGVSAAISNYKFGKEDVLAAILDLCAKGYIKLKQINKNYEIYDNNKDKSLLLKNELYVLESVLNNVKIDIKEWIKLSKEDTINLGLAQKSEEVKYKSLFAFDKKFCFNLAYVSYGGSLLFILFINYFINKKIQLILSLFGALIFTPAVWFLLFWICIFLAVIYDGKILSYKAKKENMLVLTELGKNEYHELCSLGKFLNDFGRFAEKHVNEIVIWEQYLSYAIMFRLGEKILSTGYDKLKINESFIIDDLDKINL